MVGVQRPGQLTCSSVLLKPREQNSPGVSCSRTAVHRNQRVLRENGLLFGLPNISQTALPKQMHTEHAFCIARRQL